MGFPSFVKAVDQLGETNKARAEALGVSETTYYEIKRGVFPDYLKRLAKHPVLLEALLDDARSGHTNGSHPAITTN